MRWSLRFIAKLNLKNHNVSKETLDWLFSFDLTVL